MLLSDIPTLAAHHSPDTVAIRFHERTLTYAQLRDRCWRLSNALAQIAAPGERIAILAENCPEYVECYYGVPGAGMALTLLNYRLAARELAYIIGDAAPSVLIVEPKYLPVIRQIREQIPSVRHLVVIGADAEGDVSYDDLVARGAPTPPPSPPAEDALCWLLYTSGTTGLPKGAMLSHRNLMAAVLNGLAAWEQSPEEVNLFTFPLFHVAGYVMPMYHLRAQPVVLLRSFEPATLLSNVETWRVTNTAMAPTMVAMLLEDPNTDRYDLSSLRRLGYGASSMPAEVLRRARIRWPHIGFMTGFGMTELAGNVMYMGRQDHERAAAEGLEILRSVGRQMPLARVRVIDEADRDCPPDVAGEIVVKGDQVLSGYWGNPEATEKSFIDGWFRTGDVGRWDADGYLYIVDRKKDMILTGGENVYPREVEEVLYEHPAVLEAAVIGAPDETWGELVVAVVCTRLGENVTPEELIAHCRAQIASYKKPRQVVFIDALPKNASGKVLKRELRDRIASGELVFA
ncbi:MAG: long-chain fatty acid--CoA ligase, partial [Caulobacterales bacterium]